MTKQSSKSKPRRTDVARQRAEQSDSAWLRFTQGGGVARTLLGLLVVLLLTVISQLGGDLEFDSKLGAGTEAIVTIPLGAQPPEDETATFEHAGPAERREIAP